MMIKYYSRTIKKGRGGGGGFGRNITQKQETWSLQYSTMHSHTNTINTNRLKPSATLVF